MAEYLDKEGLEYYTELVKDKMVFDDPATGSIPVHTAIYWDEVSGTPTNLVDMIYPVGSIYISVNNTDPSVLFGGTWSAIQDGFYLRASSSDGGTLLNEKLPNIKGSMQFDWGTATTGPWQALGAFTSTAVKTGRPNMYDTNQAIGTVDFDAHRSNSIYEDDAHVQPKSIKVFMWQRTA